MFDVIEVLSSLRQEFAGFSGFAPMEESTFLVGILNGKIAVKLSPDDICGKNESQLVDCARRKLASAQKIIEEWNA